MSDTPNNSSGTDIVNLGISVDATQPEKAAEALDKLAAATIGATDGLNTVSKASVSATEAIGKGTTAVQRRIIELQRQWEEEQKAIQAIEDYRKAQEKLADESSAFIVKLNEMLQTFGMSREELLRYKAAMLGVSQSAEPLIAQLEAQRKALDEKSISEKRDIELMRMRADEERAAAQKQAEIQSIIEKRDVEMWQARGKQHNDYIKWWEEELSAQEKASAQRQDIEQKRDVELHRMRQQAHKDYIKWWEEELSTKERTAAAESKAAEKAAIDEINWAQKSADQKIKILQQLEKYQQAGISKDTINSTFGTAAQKDLANLNSLLAGYQKTVDETTKTHKGAHATANNFAEALENISFKSARARSELIVLAHEAVQGRFSRMPASMMVLAEYTNAAGLAFSAAGVGALAFLGTIALLAVGAGKGAIELDHFEKSLIRTGNAAGVTRDSVHDMAEIVSGNATSAGVGKATKMLDELAGTGRFTQESLQSVGQAALEFAHITGESADNVVKEFSKMADGVTRWAEEHNKSMHFLTLTQLEYIKNLEEQGRKQEAMIEVTNKLNSHLDGHKQQVGALVQYYREWSKGIDIIWEKIKSIGKTPTTNQALNTSVDRAVDFQSRIQRALGKQDFTQEDIDKSTSEEVKNWYKAYTMYKAEARKLADQKDAEQRKASRDSDFAETQQAGIEAAKRLEPITKQIRTPSEKRKDTIAGIHSDAAQVNAAIIDEALQKQGLAYKDFAKEAIEADRAVTAEQKANGALRISARDEELKKQFEIAKQYGIKLRVDQETLAKLDSEVGDKWKDPKPRRTASAPNDGRSTALRAQLEEFQAEFNETKRATDLNKKLLSDAYRAQEIDAETYYGTLKILRNDELAALEATNKKKLDLLNGYQARNKVDAESAKRLVVDQIANYEKLKDAIEGEDAVTTQQQELERKKQLGDIVRRVVSDGQKELEHMERAIEKQEQYNAKALGGEEAKLSVIKKQNDIKVEQYELDAQYLENLLAEGGLNDAAVAAYQARLNALKSLVEAGKKYSLDLAIGSKIQEENEAMKLLTRQLEQALQHAQKFEKGMKAAFGNVGEAIGGVVIALTEFDKRQQQIEVNRRQAMKAAGDDLEKQRLANDEAESEKLDNQLQMYVNLTDAAKKFFDKESAAYRVMDGISKAVQMTQAVLQLSQLALTNPATLAAIAAITVISSLFGNGDVKNGHMSKENMQKNQGTGSVLGDATAKSQSLSKSLDLIAKNSDSTMPISQGMLKALKSIDSSMKGLANAIARSVGLTGGETLGIPLSTVDKKLGGIWGKTTRDLVDSGIAIQNAKFQDLMNGLGASQYGTVKETSSSWFGLVKDTNYSQQFGQMDPKTAQMLGKVFKGIGDSISQSTVALGYTPTSVNNAVSGATLSNYFLSTRDLKGQELTDAIDSYFSKISDDLAQAVTPGFEDFQQVGEGYSQTLVRVANSVDQANSVLKKFNISAISYRDVVDKQGDISFEIVQRSIHNAETFNGSLSGVGKIIDNTKGSVDDLAQSYTELLSVQKQMRLLNLGEINQDIINGAGSNKDLSNALSVYQDKFFSDQEKADIAWKGMQQSFAKLNKEMPTTREGFRKLVDDLKGDVSPAGQELLGKVLALSDGFDKAVTATDNLKEKVNSNWQSIADSVIDEINRIRGVVTQSQGTGYSGALSQFATTTAQARAGDADAASKLVNLSQTLTQLAEGNTLTLQELNSVRLSTASSLEETAKILKDKYGITLKGFASGGDSSGGYYMAGEKGPEIVATGPARIFSANQTRAILTGDQQAELRALRAEVATLRPALESIAISNAKMRDIFSRYDVGSGLLTTNQIPS
jgi:phage-related minor tail protein